MKIVTDILDKIRDLKYYINWRLFLLVFCGVLITLLILSGVTDKKRGVVLMFPSARQMRLVAEERRIVSGDSREDNIARCVEALFLGPMQPELDSIHSKDARIISCVITGDTVNLNLSRDVVMDIDKLKKDFVSPYYFTIQSIVTTVCFNYRFVKRVTISFEGKHYSYIDWEGPYDAGFSPDWTLLHK